MFNLIKWDLKDIWKETKPFNIVILVFAILTLLFPIKLIETYIPKLNTLTTAWPVIVSTLFILYIFSGIIYTIFKMFRNIKNNTSWLQLIINRSSLQIILSKIIVTIILAVIILSVSYLLQLSVSHFNTDNSEYFSIDFEGSIIDTLISIVVSAITIYFAYVLAKSFKFSRKNPILWLIIFLIILGSINGLVNWGISYIAGAEITYSFNHFEEGFGLNISLDNMNNNLYTVLNYVKNICFLFILTYGSSRLLENKFEN